MKKLIVIIFIIFGAFLAFSLYRTYAYDTSVVEETPSTTDLEYTFKIGNSSIKQITVDSGETKYYDVVLGNPNPAKISYSIYFEMVSPSTKPDGFCIEYTSKSTGDSTGKVDKEGNITLNLVVTNTSSSTVTVKLGSLAGYVNGGELVLESGQVLIPKQSAASYVSGLDDGTTGDSGSGVYKVEHDAIASDDSASGNDIPPVTDYRYYGANPNNYICLDMNGGSTCPDRGLFRIIGSIYEENNGKNLIKVIKATPITDGTTSTFSWDYTSSGSYKNNWPTGTLMTLLNSGAWWSNNSGSYYNNSTTATTVNFTDKGLTETAQKMINESLYYLGGWNTSAIKTTEMYSYERGTTTYSGNALSWTGKVGLMYPTDYGYAAGNSCATGTNLDDYGSSCMNKDWLYNSSNFQWLMSPGSSKSRISWAVHFVGYADYESGVRNLGSVSPVFYLTSDVVITGGTGTSSDPYLVSK